MEHATRAGLPHTAIALVRMANETNTAAVVRRCAAQPSAALALLDITCEN
jgi:hypothetical protein